MANVVLIGCGQLGSRHLQGIKRIHVDIDLFVVDSSEISLELARVRYAEIEDNSHIKSLSYCTSINELPLNLDVVVIATNSAPRFIITENLLERCKVKYIIFEKFLFQSLNEYEKMKCLLAREGVESWVNCPRRQLPHFQKIKELLKDETNITFSYKGSNWGLCCNSIHFVDLFSMVSNERSVKYDMNALDSRIYDSKREGYIELKGTIQGITPLGSKLSLSCIDDYQGANVIYIESLNYKIKIIEGECKVMINDDVFHYEVSYQSVRTGALIEDILLRGETTITKFGVSANLHYDFLQSLIQWYNGLTGESVSSLPIT